MTSAGERSYGEWDAPRRNDRRPGAGDSRDTAVVDVGRLSPRQAECLRLVYQRRTSKEIAAATGLAAGTVDTYIAEAVAALGARNRRHAAEVLHSAEHPEKVEPGSAGVSEASLPPPSEDQPLRRVGWADLLPFRRQGAIGNDLHPLVRLAWIVQLAAALAVGFGMLAVGAEVFSRLFGGA